tara:strand:- start:77 stop:208 length:132 start_codon:yes stop_codon:yes gene_type:complete
MNGDQEISEKNLQELDPGSFLALLVKWFVEEWCEMSGVSNRTP